MTPRSLEATRPLTEVIVDEDPSPVTFDLPAADDGAYPLSVRGISKHWRTGGPPVLDELDLTLEPGTITWVGGRNGAGKTTLLRVAAGLIEPDAGSVTVWGVSVHQNRVRYQRLVALLPAGDRGLYARLTVRRQLEFCARIALIARRRVGPLVDEAMHAFALDELADRRVDRMSMGQRQRLRIATTFMVDPEIVLLDEPLTSLDGDSAALLDRAIDGVLGRDGAVLWCSPSGEHLNRPFDVRLILDQGRLARA